MAKEIKLEKQVRSTLLGDVEISVASLMSARRSESR